MPGTRFQSTNLNLKLLAGKFTNSNWNLQFKQTSSDEKQYSTFGTQGRIDGKASILQRGANNLDEKRRVDVLAASIAISHTNHKTNAFP